jgi:hypothetical protein
LWQQEIIIMTSVIVEFQKREKIGAKAVIDDVQPGHSAEVIIFPGVRRERLKDASLPDDATDTPPTTRRKKTS